MKHSPRVSWVETQVHNRYAAARILDVGFVGDYEQPFLHVALRSQNVSAEIVGIDTNVDGILRWNLPYTLAADAQKLPFPDSSFDVVLCLEVVEHLYCPMSVFMEFSRVLRTGGDLILTTPSVWSLWRVLRHWILGSLRSCARQDVVRRFLGHPDHKQFYDPFSLINLLSDVGLRTEMITTKNHAIPFLRRWFRQFDCLDLSFYPMNRFGGYICLRAQKK